MTVAIINISKFSDLERALKKIVQDAMEDEVATKAIELGVKNVASEVYAKYTPYSSDGVTPHYERTYELMSSFEYNPIHNGIEVYNDRSEGGRNIAEVIETGVGFLWGYTRNLDEEIGARPFMAKTREDLKYGEFKKSLEKGLNVRGIDTK